MASFKIKPNKLWSGNCLAVAPDWVLGANKHEYFVGSSATTGTMSVWLYDDWDLKEMIEFMSKKIIGKYEANIFKHTLFELYSILKCGEITSEVFNKDIEYFTYLIKTFQPNDIITRNINYYFPQTKSHKEKIRILYLLISIQHLICEKSERLDLRIPTVCQL